jgi:hypothetical protein
MDFKLIINEAANDLCCARRSMSFSPFTFLINNFLLLLMSAMRVKTSRPQAFVMILNEKFLKID